MPNAAVAVVKEGLSNYSCLALSAQAARDLIRTKAREGMEKMAGIKPYRVEGPVTIEIERTTRNALGVDPPAAPDAEVVDARTVRYRGKDFLEAWIRARR